MTFAGQGSRQEAIDRARYLHTLRELAAELDHSAALHHNQAPARAAKWGDYLKDQSHAVKWALRQIDPQTEVQNEFYRQLAGE